MQPARPIWLAPTTLATPRGAPTSLSRLTDALQRAGYHGPFDAGAVARGDPAAVLPLLHFALLGTSKPVALWLAEVGSGLSAGMSDARFVTMLQRVLRDHLGYRCVLSTPQILTSSGFAEKKICLILDVLKLCREKHLAIAASSRRQRASSSTGAIRTVATGTPRGAGLAQSPHTAPNKQARAMHNGLEQRAVPPLPTRSLQQQLDADPELVLPRTAPPPRPMRRESGYVHVVELS